LFNGVLQRMSDNHEDYKLKKMLGQNGGRASLATKIQKPEKGAGFGIFSIY
jgi:hypothetical protein